MLAPVNTLASKALNNICLDGNVMRRKKESELERWAARWARARRITVSKLTDPTGILDHVFWLTGGRPLLVEFKDPNGTTAPGREKLQQYYRRKLSKQGYSVAKVDTKEQFLEAVNESLSA